MTAPQWYSALVCSALISCATTAAASEHFPTVVQSALGLAKAPPCTLCHESDSGGENTATKPFARTMQRFGAVKKNDDSLVLALQRADAEGTDSDGDCIPDIDELVAKPQTDPNVPEKGPDAGHCAVPANPPVLRTGCTVSSHDRSQSVTAAGGVFLFTFLRRRRRKITRRVPSFEGHFLNAPCVTVVPDHKENRE